MSLTTWRPADHSDSGTKGGDGELGVIGQEAQVRERDDVEVNERS